ncbi:MAG: hypothetical protein ACYDBQ_12600, partial [Thermoplasmatota archaeon]
MRWPLILLFLAGCSSPLAPPVSHAPLVAAPLSVPIWQVGDWWNYTVSGARQGSMTLAVEGATGTDWKVGTDSPDEAFLDARTDVSFLGAIRKSDLAGSQGATRVAYFQWPLADNATWTTTWDQAVRVIVAHRLNATEYQFFANDSNGTRYASYVYDASAGWWRNLVFYDSGGAPRITFSLASHGHGYRGLVATWALSTLYQGNGTNGSFDSQSVTVANGTTMLWLTYHLACAQGGGYLVRLSPLGSTSGYQADGNCTKVDVDAPAAV